ncbi:PqqD family protein [Limnobacter parvus]|uniref:PqqD family protein n=1 Tax=Limnobacter parvus TaxID=2939690 RepID=A0ABT1XDC0_9BURK|nr:PqqD family protein [Limnobacter parvus]MCR2745272.1 PqqD family protein [Limnobacter parvus]
METIAKQQAARLLLKFSGVGQGLCVPNHLALMNALREVVPTWDFTEEALSSDCEIGDHCVAHVSIAFHAPLCYNINSIYTEEPMMGLSTASAVCSLLADILETHISNSANPIALHAGAFVMGGKLIAVSGPRRAGKSTLISRLCAEPDVQIYCDDVLPVNPSGHGIALGLAPRLRLPLPKLASPVFRQHVQQHLGPHDERYGYLCSANVAAHGTTHPLAALIILDRRAQATNAHFCELNEDDALFYALQQNMGNFANPQEALLRTQALLGNVRCLRLVYHDLEDAVALLRQAFGQSAEPYTNLPVQPAQAWQPETARAAEPIRAKQVFARAPGAAVRRIGNSTFLWLASENSVWRLNTVAEAVWALLETPGSAEELADVLGEVFVQVPKAQLEKDIAGLMAVMKEEGFCSELIKSKTRPVDSWALRGMRSAAYLN